MTTFVTFIPVFGSINIANIFSNLLIISGAGNFLW